MEIDGRELALFNRKIAWNSIILEGFPIDMYHIMPRVVHLSRFLGNRSSGQHRHRVWEFNLILRGEMTFFWGDQSVELGSGDVFFMPPDSLHGWQMLSPDFMILGLQTSISFIGGNRFHLKRQLIDAMDGLRHHIREEHSLVQAAQEMIRLLLEGPAFYRESAHLELHSIYLALFRRLFPLGLGHDLDALDAEATMGLGGKRIAEILEYYINDNMGRPVRVSEICKRFRIGKCQLNRICRRETGMTTSSYIASRKIGMAKHLLENTERMVKEIAMLIGYHDVNYFCRVFKKQTGMTPEKFRESNQ